MRVRRLATVCPSLLTLLYTHACVLTHPGMHCASMLATYGLTYCGAPAGAVASSSRHSACRGRGKGRGSGSGSGSGSGRGSGTGINELGGGEHRRPEQWRGSQQPGISS